MRGLIYVIVASWLALTAHPCMAAGSGAEAGAEEDLLQIHLPRDVTVRESLLSLGQISVIRGAGPLAATAGSIRLGRFSMPGQQIVLDRSTILSRLASHGLSADEVRLTGAQTVTVHRYQQIITGDEFIDIARRFLAQQPPAASLHESIAPVKPKDLVLPERPETLQVTPRLIRNVVGGFVTIQIVVTADGQEVGSREIPFRLRYRSRRAVTLKEIAEGAVLTPENVKIEETVSDRPESSGWKPPYGLIARRALAADIELREDMVDSAQPVVVIRRNETVVIRVRRPGLMVTAVGLALQQARAGEYLKVRNTDSHRVIVCRVNPDGTVEPML